MRKKSAILISILTLWLLYPIGLRADLIVWCVGDSQKVSPYDNIEEKNFFWDGKEKIVRLYGAKNEYVAFQIIVRGSVNRVSGVRIIADDFKNSRDALISKDNIDLFREHYLKVTIPSSVDEKPVEDAKVGEYPTQMIPFYPIRKIGTPFDVEAGRNQPVWVDLYIPEDAKAGEYESFFTLTADEKDPIRIKILLTVWDFILPHETHFRTYIYYGSEQIRWAYRYKYSGDPAFRELEGGFFQMAHQHRLVLCPNIEMEWGYDKFDEYWDNRGRGKYIDGSAYTKRVGKGIPANTWIVEIDNFDHQPEYQRLAKAVVDFFKKKNLSKILMLYVYDEPHSKKAYDFIRERCQWVHEAVGKELPCMVTVPIRPPHFSWGSLIGYVDVWNSRDFTLKDMKERMKAGDKIWTYNMGWGGGPYVDTPGISGRTQAWVGWKFGFDGWMFWDSCYWIDISNLRDTEGKKIKFSEINSTPSKYSTNVWENPMTFDQTRRAGYRESDALRLNGDGVLFYPGKDIGLEKPISSFVMKSLRRGLQDYEYLWLAKRMGKEKETATIVDRLILAPKRWNKDVNAWYQARIDVAKEILSALSQKR